MREGQSESLGPKSKALSDDGVHAIMELSFWSRPASGKRATRQIFASSFNSRFPSQSFGTMGRWLLPESMEAGEGHGDGTTAPGMIGRSEPPECRPEVGVAGTPPAIEAALAPKRH